MATTPEHISYDGNPTNPNGLTPFGIFDLEALHPLWDILNGLLQNLQPSGRPSEIEIHYQS